MSLKYDPRPNTVAESLFLFTLAGIATAGIEGCESCLPTYEPTPKAQVQSIATENQFDGVSLPALDNVLIK